jgi:rubrerythrin
MDDQSRVHDESIEPGALVYDSNRRPVGRVSGLTEEGFEAETVELDGSEVEELPGQEFGEGYLMWRCTECGEMDELEDGMPESCPNCGAPREALSAIEED